MPHIKTREGQRKSVVQEKAKARQAELDKHKKWLFDGFPDVPHTSPVIGKRIEKERTAKNLTKIELAKLLNVDRGTIARWEQGDIPQLRDMLLLCKLFDCEIGYLLCEPRYGESKTITVAAACETTGLSDAAIKTLQFWNKVIKIEYHKDGREKKRSAHNKDGTPFVFKNPLHAMSFHLAGKVLYFDQELAALNFLIEQGTHLISDNEDYSFFRGLYAFLQQDVEYFSEGEYNPTHEGDTIHASLFRHPNKEPERVINNHEMYVKAFENGNETKKRILFSRIKDAERLHLMDALSMLRDIAKKEATNGKH
ncbi:MAG: helix-turn-helix domain-containing protein [Defluviitaleaceae bacterium]|nr:helix-turn-helix domain-containing protein [Defluviitaleaceae bacterium]